MVYAHDADHCAVLSGKRSFHERGIAPPITLSSGGYHFEIPSGYFSDVVGRKATIVLACILSFLGFSIYTISYGFTGFLIAELVLGLGSSFLSGTDSAILYDSLLQANRDGEYKNTKADFPPSVLGGARKLCRWTLAVISLRTPIYAEAIVVFFLYLLH